jgi:hypothetical protein
MTRGPKPVLTSSGGGASGSVIEVGYSPVDIAQAASVGVAELAGAGGSTAGGGGPNTSGSRFYVTKAATCTGVRFFWRPNTSRTVRCSLWDNTAGTRLKQIDIAVVNQGIYSGTFASSQALTPGKLYAVSFYDLAGVDYSYINGIQSYVMPQYGGPHLIWNSWTAWSSSDVFPASSASTEKYPVEPIFTVP